MAVRAKRHLPGELPLFIGHQWGEPPRGQDHFLVSRIGEELEITAAMPQYLSELCSCDLVLQYEKARKDRSVGKKRTGKDSPHIRFANAENDDDLIDFVCRFGPVVSMSWKLLPHALAPGSSREGDLPFQDLMRVRQDLGELRIEHRIYKAAVGLVLELAKKELEFDIDSAKERMDEIAQGISDWQRQWNREKRERGKNPLWRIRADSIRRIAALAKSSPDRFLPPQLDARIVICELVNVFPSLVFPNPPEMHSYIRFGIRPLLYSLLKREFLHPRDVAICANTHCRAIFEVERAHQRFCDDECSRHERQREYWQNRGKTVRRGRLDAQSKRRDVKLARPASPGRAI